MARKREKPLPNVRRRVTKDGEGRNELRVNGRNLGTFSDAEIEVERARAVLRGDLSAQRSGPVTRQTPFGALALLCLEVEEPGLNDNSVPTYRTQLRVIEEKAPRFWSMPIGDINRGEVKRTRSELQKYYSPVYVNQIMRQVSRVLEAAVGDYEVLHANCMAGMKHLPVPKRTPPSIADDDVTALTDAAHGITRAPVLVALFTGLRSGEIRGLTMERCLLDTNQLVVEVQLRYNRRTHETEVAALKHRRMVDGEPEGGRTIDIPPFLSEEIRAHVEQYGPGPDGLAFRAPRGGPLNSTTLHYHWKTFLRAAGLPERLRIHDMRHNAITFMLSRGVPLPLAQYYAGHVHPTTTLRYMHLQQADTSTVATLFADRALATVGQERKARAV